MPTRRTVLKSAALSIIGSAFPVSVIAKQVLSAPVVVVYENGIAESVAFKDALKRRASSIHVLKQDPAATFSELCCTQPAGAIVLGCTKGAAAFVLGELARQRGGKMLIYAEHRYRHGGLAQHTLHFPVAEKTEFARNWNVELAVALEAEKFRATPAQGKAVTTTAYRPATGPDYLVTWGILP